MNFAVRQERNTKVCALYNFLLKQNQDIVWQTASLNAQTTEGIRYQPPANSPHKRDGALELSRPHRWKKLIVSLASGVKLCPNLTDFAWIKFRYSIANKLYFSKRRFRFLSLVWEEHKHRMVKHLVQWQLHAQHFTWGVILVTKTDCELKLFSTVHFITDN